MKKSTEILTQKRLHELLHYDPLTGIFTNKIRRGRRALKGSIAGFDNGAGYLYVHIDSRSYRANRLAWFYMEGYWPENEIDHENRIKDDNRWINLRHVSRQCNCRNKRLDSRNRSGITGVNYYEKSGKWQVYITVSRKNIHLGFYSELNKAVLERWKAEKKYNFENCNTTSSAYLYLKKHGLLEVR